MNIGREDTTAVVPHHPRRTAARTILIAAALALITLLLIASAAFICAKALRRGIVFYAAALAEPDALAAIRLTFLVAVISAPANTLFGFSGRLVHCQIRFSS